MQHTIITERPAETVQARHAAVNALAVVGFLTLVFIGIVLAIYAARYVPETISRIAAGAAYLSIDGSDEDGDGQLQVVPSLPFPSDDTIAPATTTPVAPVATTTAPTKPATGGTTVIYRTATTSYPTPGSIRIPVGGSTGPMFGDSNLVPTITAVGYMNGNRFVSDRTIEDNQELAVQFRVTNKGTNETGSWKLTVTIPTKSDKTFEFKSGNQASLKPNGYIDFTIHLDKNDARVGDDQRIRVEVDPSDAVDESNERDNEATATIDVDKN